MLKYLRLALIGAGLLAAVPALAQTQQMQGAPVTPGGSRVDVMPTAQMNMACNGGLGNFVGQLETAGANSGGVCSLPVTGSGGGTSAPVTAAGTSATTAGAVQGVTGGVPVPIVQTPAVMSADGLTVVTAAVMDPDWHANLALDDTGPNYETIVAACQPYVVTPVHPQRVWE